MRQSISAHIPAEILRFSLGLAVWDTLFQGITTTAWANCTGGASPCLRALAFWRGQLQRNSIIGLTILALAGCTTSTTYNVTVPEAPAVAEPPPAEQPPPPPAVAQAPASNQAIVERIIRQSRNAYYASGHPCACPDDVTRSGRACGNSSAYSKAGGIKCFPRDVTPADVAAYRAEHR